MASFVYVLCALIAVLCALLLLRGYQKSRQRLLLWSGLCFVGLTLSNILVIVDLVLLPAEIDLYALRLAAAAAGMLVLLYGLVWESD